MYPYERAEQQKRDEIEYEHEKRYDSLSDRATPVALLDQRCQQELIDNVELDPFPGIDDVIAVNDFVFELEFAAHISVAHHNGIVENDAVVDQGVVADDRTRTDAGIFSQLDRTAENDRCADRDAFWNLYIAPYDECGAVAVPRQVVTCGLFIYDPHVLLIKHLNGIDRSNFKDIGTELHFRRGVREIGEPVPADQIPAVRFSKSPAAKGVRVELQRFGFALVIVNPDHARQKQQVVAGAECAVFQQEFFEGFLRMSCRIADLNSQRHTITEMVVKLRRGIVRNDPDLPDSAQNAEINQKTEIRFVAEPQQVRRIIREKFPDPLRAGLWTIQDCFHSIPFQ